MSDTLVSVVFAEAVAIDGKQHKHLSPDVLKGMEATVEISEYYITIAHKNGRKTRVWNSNLRFMTFEPVKPEQKSKSK